jgi:type II secretory pathway pseudopilin PulG
MLRRRRGFSLVELSILLVIAGLMMAGVLSMMPGKNERASRVATKSRLTEISDAIIAYRDRNGYYPCVASRSDLPNTANYGRTVLTNCVADTSTPAGTDRLETSGGSGI